MEIKKYEPLWGSWYVGSFIGEGSTGRVYKVVKKEWDITLESALKIICVPTKEQYLDAKAVLNGNCAGMEKYFEDIVRNIINEVRLLYKLRGNSNIIAYEDHLVSKKDNGIGWDVFIRMEYAESLPKYLSGKKLGTAEIVRMAMDICTALDICAKYNVVHRDIKDDNIFVTSGGVFKLGDFSIAKETGSKDLSASIKGTPLYIAPEVFRGESSSPLSDIYSLGIVMYKLLNSGRIPFAPEYPKEIKYSDNERAVAKRIAGEPIPVPADADEELGSIVLKACSYNPDRRYQSAVEMKRDLEDYLSRAIISREDWLIDLESGRLVRGDGCKRRGKEDFERKGVRDGWLYL